MQRNTYKIDRSERGASLLEMSCTISLVALIAIAGVKEGGRTVNCKLNSSTAIASVAEHRSQLGLPYCSYSTSDGGRAEFSANSGDCHAIVEAAFQQACSGESIELGVTIGPDGHARRRRR